MAKKAIKSISQVLGEKKSDNEIIAMGACVLSVSYRKNTQNNQVEPLIWLQRARTADPEQQAKYEEEIQKLNEKFNVEFVPTTGIANIPQNWGGRNGFNNVTFVKSIEEATSDLKKATAEKLGASTQTANVPGL